MKCAKNETWGAQNDRTGLASIFTIEVDLPRPLSSEIWDLMWVKMTKNQRNFLFSSIKTWCVQSIEQMMGIIVGIGID